MFWRISGIDLLLSGNGPHSWNHHFVSVRVASVIRLGYFNVMEEKRQNETSELRQYYQGLPITSMAIILPFIYLLRKGCGANFLLVIHVAVVVVGVLFISDIKVKKPQNPMVILLVALVALALSMMFHLL